MMPDDVFIVAHRDSESHDMLCDAMIGCGFILAGGRLYEVIGAVPIADASWRWTLRAPRPCLWPIDDRPFVASA
jgi:hypothetical protein